VWVAVVWKRVVAEGVTETPEHHFAAAGPSDRAV
jgi:hypothetical protein